MALPTTFAADRSAALDRFARSIAGADSAIDTLTAWCGGEPPVTRIHMREETVALPEEALLLRAPAAVRVQRRQVTHRRRGGAVLCDARATVWLDNPLLPAQTVRRLRFAPLPLGQVLRPLGVRRHTNSVGRRHDDRRPVGDADEDRPVLLVRATLLVAGQPVALVEETYLEAVLSRTGSGRAG
jgi:hypothetical protein